MRLVVRSRVLTATLAIVLLLSACSSVTSGTPVAGAGGSTGASSSPTSGTSSAPTPTKPVHVSLLEGDGGVYGVGMPIIAYFDRKVTDATAFDKAVTVTVNGAPADGAWYWQTSGITGKVLEAHYRLREYWPAHAQIAVDLPVKGLSAGKGLAYDDSLTLSISTGTANVSSVDCGTEQMTVTSDGKTVRTMPVSCGKAKTPTYTGVKVVMQKGESLPGTSKLRPQGTVNMVSNNPADPYNLMVPWSVRLTNSGEYAHAASWNGGNIGSRSTSNGCTNLNVSDAKWFYMFSKIGDVLTYANTGGKKMPSWDGYGDWNLPWGAWQTGGAVSATR
jgi:lipoprotein-anchoring transpeptidase ErfK/SrfK